MLRCVGNNVSEPPRPVKEQRCPLPALLGGFARMPKSGADGAR